MQTDTYKGDDHFEKIINGLGIDMTVYEMKMYMLGYLMSPEPISPMMPLDEILLKDTDFEIEFKTEKEAQEFHSGYMALWNQLVSYEGSSSRYPKLSEAKTSFKNKDEKIKYICIKAEELGSFYMGLDESMASDYISQCFELLMAQMSLTMINDIFTDFNFAISEGREVADESIEEVLVIVKDFNQIWPKVFKEVNALFLGIRRGEIKLDTEEEIDTKFEVYKAQMELE